VHGAPHWSRDEITAQTASLLSDQAAVNRYRVATRCERDGPSASTRWNCRAGASRWWACRWEATWTHGGRA